MSKILAAIALVAMSCTPADANEFRVHHTYTFAPYRMFGRSSADIQQLPPMTDAQRAEDQQWLDFCKPERKADDLGVIRLTYSHKGCEFGRTQ